jgi:quinol monooxygenase YgiN
MIMVQSTFQLLPKGKSTVIDLMKNMVQLSLAEPGCTSYEYFEGITNTDQIILLQEWKMLKACKIITKQNTWIIS